MALSLGRFSALVKISLVLSLLGFSVLSQAECSLETTWEPWEPYQYQTDGQITGLDVDLVRAIMAQAGCDVNFNKRPWARALKEVESGSIHVVSGASINDERRQYANFSEPYRDETMVLMVRKGESGNYALKALTDIISGDFRLGVVRDYYYGEQHKQNMLNAEYKKRVSVVNTDTANLKKLVSGRVDGILIDRYTGPFLAKQEGLGGKLEVHPLSVNSDNIYLMFSKKSVDAATIDKVNAALAAIKANGTYDKIVNNYLE
ncbi:MAG: transporter substrate-binding domain-containing protein [Oleiphilaceae bacterium]|nr:transporter substrate-binding domain-containing protein [Oleiphilaceae bacterium]